jgi:hypothetical protein
MAFFETWVRPFLKRSLKKNKMRVQDRDYRRAPVVVVVKNGKTAKFIILDIH